MGASKPRGPRGAGPGLRGRAGLQARQGVTATLSQKEREQPRLQRVSCNVHQARPT